MKLSDSRRIAAMYWCQLLMDKTGCSTKGLEDLLVPKETKRLADGYSNKFKKYLKGKVAPTQDFVELVEEFSEETAGTAWVFDLPLWEALLGPVHTKFDKISAYGNYKSAI